MREHVATRIQELVAQGRSLTHPDKSWVDDVAGAQAWGTSAANAIRQVSPGSSVFCSELEGQLKLASAQMAGVPARVLEKILGILRSVQAEAQAGLLVRLENQVVASAFDDFLDHAAEYHRSGKLSESATLAAAVLEDTMKKVARKHGLNPNGKTLDPLINELAKLNVFTPVQAKRLKAHAAVRNHALHAE